MTLIELLEFVNLFEDTFDVTRVEQQDEFNVILESVADKKLHVIKEVRALSSLGLKETRTSSTALRRLFWRGC